MMAAVVMLMPVVSSVFTCVLADDVHHAWKMMAVSCCPRGDQRCDALITTHNTRLHIAEQLSHDLCTFVTKFITNEVNE